VAADHWSSDVQEPALLELMEHRKNWRTLSHKEFGVSVEQVSAFMTSDNTVITIFERSGQDVLTPILKRLQSSQTILRSSNDPSMLIQAVIDAVVDLSLPIGKAVSEAFSRLEFSVLTNPAIEQSKQLYLLRSGLTLLMDNINAVDGLVRTLIDHRTVPIPAKSSDAIPSSGPSLPSPPAISPLAQIYLQDVHDHVRTLSASTHMSIRAAENLTSLIFNTIAASQNESVRQLTLVSCFFLPLTFLTGYFGMNFDPMPIVNEHSDLVFWAIASPVMTITIILLIARARGRRFAWLRRRRRAAAVTN
jgi:Mg2+ and Co2+ transporter CorA